MTVAHRAMDVCLWLIAAHWFCLFCAEHTRRRYQRRNWCVGSPSILCERTGDWRVNLPSLARRQGE